MTTTIHSQYFVNEKLAKFLLDGPVSSLFLVHMLDREEYTAEELLSAHERQQDLIRKYKNEFASNDDFYGKEDADLSSDEFYSDLVDYILKYESK
jgi:hypothetical protein